MTLSASQLGVIREALHLGAEEASRSLSKWIQRPTSITFDSFEQLTLDEAVGVLGDPQDPLCFCAMEMTGHLEAHLVLIFDDASGLALADLLLGQAKGTAIGWNEMETSAALETTNIMCCAYLNAMARALPAGDAHDLVPSPPRFGRDFAQSLIECALMDQIVASDQVMLARTAFRIDAALVNWTLLFVPGAGALERVIEP